MTNALERAAREMQQELDLHDISVHGNTHQIFWRNLTIKVRPYTPKRECRRKLKKLIAAAKLAEVKDVQEVLL